MKPLLSSHKVLLLWMLVNLVFSPLAVFASEEPSIVNTQGGQAVSWGVYGKITPLQFIPQDPYDTAPALPPVHISVQAFLILLLCIMIASVSFVLIFARLTPEMFRLIVFSAATLGILILLGCDELGKTGYAGVMPSGSMPFGSGDDIDAAPEYCGMLGHHWMGAEFFESGQPYCCGDDSNEFYSTGADGTFGCCDEPLAIVENYQCSYMQPCEDPDGTFVNGEMNEISYMIASSVMSDRSYPDACSDETTLQEAYCNGMFPSAINISCPLYGKVCRADACADPEIICGDGVLDTGEQCDDGNTVNGDGCSDNCSIENVSNCVIPEGGMIITQNTTLCPGEYTLPAANSGNVSEAYGFILWLMADNISLTCNNTILRTSTYHGRGVYVNGSGLTISGCDFRNLGDNIYIKGMSNILVINNSFSNSSEGVHSGFRSISGIDVYSSNLTISNNHFSDTYFGVRLTGGSNHLIIGNKFTNNSASIYTDGVRNPMHNITIDSNRMTGNGQGSAIAIASRNSTFVITNNRMEMMHTAVYISGVLDNTTITLKSNSVHNITNTGLKLSADGLYLNLEDNYICGSGLTDIEASYATIINASNNICTIANNFSDFNATGCTYTCPVCGNDICEIGEADESVCPAPCNDPEGRCPGAPCYYKPGTCQQDCDGVCGDGVCNGTENESSCPVDCAPINATISIATLKDKYMLGEPVALTDPPVEDAPAVSSVVSHPVQESRDAHTLDSSVSYNNVRESLGDMRAVQSAAGQRSADEYNGYIVELNEPPLVVKEKELAEIAKENDVKIASMSKLNPLRLATSMFSITSDKIPKKVLSHRQGINKEHANAKDAIRSKLDKKGIQSITGNAVGIPEDTLAVGEEFTTVFNGMSLNITDEEAEKIKEISYVKSVQPNRRVEATLMDSVPLIGADQVWQMDEDGNPCNQTGKECLTGKNVTIAIIDTGVDYTHEDLGCTDSERCDNIILPYSLYHPRIYGDRIVWLDQRNGINDVYMYDLSTGVETLITDENSKFTGNCPDSYTPGKYMPFVYPDIFENLIVYNDCDGLLVKVYLYNISNKEETVITDKAYDLAYPRIDGKKVTWTDYRDGNTNIFMYDLATRTETRITNDEYDQRYANIQGNKIVWQDYRNDISSIYVHDILTKETKRITKDSDRPDMPSVWGNKVVWSDARNNGQWDLYMHDLVTGVETPISPYPNSNSVDAEIFGNKIVWREDRYDDSYYDVFVYDIETSSEERITANGYKNFYPHTYDNKIVWAGRYGGINTDWQIYMYDFLQQNETQITSSHSTNLDDFFPNSKVIGGYDFVNNDNDPMDDHGHGTHVAATAAGNGTLKGVAPDANIVAYKVLGSDGGGWDSWIIAAIERAADPNQDGNTSDHLDILSMSLGGAGNPDDAMSTAVDNAVNTGVVAVIAAGNSGPSSNSIGSPGTSRNAITVGATDKQDTIADFSSRGPVMWTNDQGIKKSMVKPDLVAPGVSICAAQFDSAWNDRLCFDEDHVAISGTSMATPHAAGAAALLIQKNPDWSPDEIKSALKATAVDIGEDMTTQGQGRIDSSQTIKSVRPLVAELSSLDFVISGQVDIYGTANGEDFEKYELYYGDGNQWNIICEDHNPVDSGILCNYNFDQTLGNGIYYLNLRVYGLNGGQSEDFNIFRISHIKIMNPMNNDVVRMGGIIDIIGTIKIDQFEEYSIEYAQGLDPTNWIWESEGISLTKEPGIGFSNELLAKWDTSYIDKPDFYTLKLKVTKDGIQVDEFVHKIYIDSLLKEGWPQNIIPMFDRRFGDYFEPAVEDLDDDGVKEVLIVASIVDSGDDITLFVYKADGSLWWTKGFHGGRGYNAGVIPLIGDTNNDGYKEVFLEYNSTIYGFNYDGTPLGGNWPLKLEIPFVTGDNLIPYTTYPATILADINHDGSPEFISKSFYGTNLFIIDNEGTIIKEINQPSSLTWYDIRRRFPSIGNFDDDSDLEIVSQYGDDAIIVYNLDGSVVAGWPKEIAGTQIRSSLVTADINQDGYSEIFFYSLVIDDPTKSGLFAISKNGLLWKALDNCLATIPISFSDPSIVRLGNEKKELAVAIHARGCPSAQHNIYIFDSTGKEISNFPASSNSMYGYSVVAPIIGDINGDGIGDIITPDMLGISRSLVSCGTFSFVGLEYDLSNGAGAGGIHTWTINGIPLFFNQNYPITFFISEHRSVGAPILVDLDNDNRLEIIASSLYDSSEDLGTISFCPFTSANPPQYGCSFPIIDLNCEERAKNRGSIYVWELDVPYNPETMDWPMFQHDPQHTGCYDCDKDISRPQSKIHNLGSTNLTAGLTVKVDRFINNSWQEFDIPFANVSVNIAPAQQFGIDILFNALSYTPSQSGKYRVVAELSRNGQLLVSNNKTLNASYTFEVVDCIGCNTPPLVMIDNPFNDQNFTVAQSITFNASSTFDMEGDPLLFIWNFGDGTVTNTTNAMVNHSYSTEGNFTVTLVVSDGRSTSGASVRIKIISAQQAVAQGSMQTNTNEERR